MPSSFAISRTVSPLTLRSQTSLRLSRTWSSCTVVATFCAFGLGVFRLPNLPVDHSLRHRGFELPVASTLDHPARSVALVWEPVARDVYHSASGHSVAFSFLAASAFTTDIARSTISSAIIPLSSLTEYVLPLTGNSSVPELVHLSVKAIPSVVVLGCMAFLLGCPGQPRLACCRRGGRDSAGDCDLTRGPRCLAADRSVTGLVEIVGLHGSMLRRVLADCGALRPLSCPGGRRWIRTTAGVCREVYSLVSSSTRADAHVAQQGARLCSDWLRCARSQYIAGVA